MKTAVITGASRGLGKALAYAMAKRGYALALIARQEDEHHFLIESLRSEGFQQAIKAYRFDLNELDAIESLITEIVKDFSRIDLLINNAGLGYYKPLAEHSVEEIKAIYTVNLLAPTIFNKWVGEVMCRQKSGQIINIGSDLAHRPLANMTPYAASKHGLAGMSHSLLRELKSFGVKVSLVNSGLVDTYFHQGGPGQFSTGQALNPIELAELIAGIVDNPSLQLVDELTVHPLYQDY